jgi:hypothetical protein
MRNIAFVIWMLGYSLCSLLHNYFIFLEGKVYSDNVVVISATINIIIWIWIGCLLYERKEK